MNEYQLNHFRFHQDLQVRWMDLDPLDHVNNSIYIQYFELGRGKYMSAASPSWDWHKNMFLIANITCDYRKELKLQDSHPKVWIKTGKLGTKSFELNYLITSMRDNITSIHATGKSIQVMFDMKTRTTIRIPDWLRGELSDFDGL